MQLLEHSLRRAKTWFSFVYPFIKMVLFSRDKQDCRTVDGVTLKIKIWSHHLTSVVL